MKKDNKILVVVDPDPVERRRIIARLAVRLGFARIPSDAQKIIVDDLADVDLSTAYFVLCSTHNFRGAPITNQRLYELAARGLLVLVGTRYLPREYEFICRTFYSGEV